MTEQRNAMAELFAACWKDEGLKARFMSDPKAVLAERDISPTLGDVVCVCACLAWDVLPVTGD